MEGLTGLEPIFADGLSPLIVVPGIHDGGVKHGTGPQLTQIGEAQPKGEEDQEEKEYDFFSGGFLHGMI